MKDKNIFIKRLEEKIEYYKYNLNIDCWTKDEKSILKAVIRDLESLRKVLK